MTRRERIFWAAVRLHAGSINRLQGEGDIKPGECVKIALRIEKAVAEQLPAKIVDADPLGVE